MLAEEDIEFIKTHISEWIAEQSLGKPPVVYEIELRERMVRVEEALKHQGDELKAQRELIQTILVQMDKRFEQVDKRFEQIDKRLEQVDKRFEQVDKRFEQIDKRFEQVDKQFDRIHGEIMALHHEMKQFMRWGFASLVAVGSLIVAILKLTA